MRRVFAVRQLDRKMPNGDCFAAITIGCSVMCGRGPVLYIAVSDFCPDHAATKNTFSQRTTGFLTRLSVTNGKLSASQASIPPSSGRTLVIPFARSCSATRALVASLGHEQ
jgi:hypothetical protein